MPPVVAPGHKTVRQRVDDIIVPYTVHGSMLMPENRSVPEVFADFAQIATGSAGVFLGFRAIKPLELESSELPDSEPQPEIPTELKAVVRLNLEQAKIFAIMLKRSLKQYEEQNQEVPLPAGFRDQSDLADDEW